MLVICLFAAALPIDAADAAAKPVTTPTLTIAGAQGFYVVPVGAAVGTSIGEVQATSTDPNAVVTYTVSGLTGIAINQDTGVLSVKNSPLATSELKRAFKVKASDGTRSVQATFTLLTMPAETFTHGITEERWNNISGTKVSNLTENANFRKAPDTTIVTSQIGHSVSDGDTYGSRYTGFVVAPSTGWYTFWISSDDSSELWLGKSANSDSFGSQPIAAQPNFNNLNIWNANPAQKSAPVFLTGGQTYAIKVLHKEQYSGDHISVAWQGPGMPAPINGSATNTIPADNLYPSTAIDWTPPPKPAYATVSKITSTSATISWNPVTDVSGVVKYIVSRNGRKISEVLATSATIYHFNDVVRSGSHRYSVTAVDGKGNVSQPANIANFLSGSAFDPIDKAVATGDPVWLTDAAPVIAAAQAEIASMLNAQNSLVSNLYAGVPSVSLVLPQYSRGSLISPLQTASHRVSTILRASDTASTSLAVAGTDPSGSRFAAFGGNPLTVSNTAAAKRLVAWLLKGDGSAPISSTTNIAILNDSASAMKTWLTSSGGVSSGTIATCTAANYSTCLDGASLIIVGSQVPIDNPKTALNPVETMRAAISKAVLNRVPILWVSDAGCCPGDPIQEVALSILGAELTGSSYWPGMSAVYQTPEAIDAMARFNPFQGVSTMLGHFAADDWNINLSMCLTNSCPADSAALAYLNSEFYGGAKTFLQSKLSSFDSKGLNLFTTLPSEMRLIKLLVLLGDVYRRHIVYPLHASTAPNSAFFKSYFADFSVYNLRKVNPAQPDLGNFSSPIPATVKRFNDALNFSTKTETYFTAAGVYALPGQTFTVTRTDSTATSLAIGINSLRPTSTWEMTSYTRPKYLRSPWITLVKGKTMVITSPYGGPIQIQIGSLEPSAQVSISITNVGHHPVWDGPATTASFNAGIAAGIYNWAEIKTPGIEIHANRRLMLEALKDEAFNTADRLVASAYKYHYQSLYGVAGFVGSGLVFPPAVQSICAAKQLDCTNPSINRVPVVTHFNSDQGSCGYGCSGNPYDAAWAYKPIGWGESHEVGHNIQRFMIYGGKSTETTNDIYSAHTHGLWNKEVPYLWRGAPFSSKPEVTFNAMIAAQKYVNPSTGLTEPIEFMNDVVWETEASAALRGVPSVQWDVQRLHFFWHLVQQSRENTRVAFGNDGWDFWTLMNVIDREFVYDAKDETRWTAHSEGLGFAGMNRLTAAALDANDRTLIEASYLAKLDQRPFFDLWGIGYSKTASDHVASFNFEPAPRRFWYYSLDSDGDPDFSGVAAGSLPIDGTVTSIPKVPVAFNFTPPDFTSTAYPWPQITTVSVGKPIKLRTAVGTASTVSFLANNVPIPECNNRPTVSYDWTNPAVEAPRGSAGGAGEVVATCLWYPQTTGAITITTVVTPINATFLPPTTNPIIITATPDTSAPTITSSSRSSGLESSTVELTGSNLSAINEVNFNGVNVDFVASSDSSIIVTVPAVTPEQVGGYFALSNASGYRTYSPGFTVLKPVDSVTLGLTTMTINPGKVVVLSPTVNPSYATDKSLVWTSSNPAIATVSDSGRVVAVATGTTTITASSVDGAKTASIATEVSSASIAEVVAIEGQPVAVDLGATATALATALPTNAGRTDLTWSSSNTAIASVTANGTVTGVALGSTTLIARAVNGVTTNIPVTVNVAVTANDVDNTLVGLTTQMQFSTNNGFNWTTSNGSNTPGLTGNRMIKIRKSGTTTPVKTVLFTDGTNSATNPATTVVVGSIYLSDLAWSTQSNGYGGAEHDLSNGSTSINDGGNLTINGATYAKGIGAHSTSNIEIVLDKKYARFKSDIGVDDSVDDKGSVKFEVFGDGTSLYRSPTQLTGSDGAQSIDINVVGVTTLKLFVDESNASGSSDHADWAGARLIPAVASVTVSPSTVALTPSATATLDGSIIAESGVSATLSWSSSNDSIATVDSAGVVTAVGIGTAVITATSSVGAVTDSATVRVAVPPPNSLTLNPNTLSLSPSATARINPVGITDVQWTSADPSIASVDNAGVVTAVGLGTTTIIATTTDGEYESRATVVVSSGDQGAASASADEGFGSIYPTHGGTEFASPSITGAIADIGTPAAERPQVAQGSTTEAVAIPAVPVGMLLPATGSGDRRDAFAAAVMLVILGTGANLLGRRRRRA